MILYDDRTYFIGPMLLYDDRTYFIDPMFWYDDRTYFIGLMLLYDVTICGIPRGKNRASQPILILVNIARYAERLFYGEIFRGSRAYMTYIILKITKKSSANISADLQNTNWRFTKSKFKTILKQSDKRKYNEILDKRNFYQNDINPKFILQ